MENGPWTKEVLGVGSSPEACVRECRATSQCLGFAYAWGNCWLKGSSKTFPKQGVTVRRLASRVRCNVRISGNVQAYICSKDAIESVDAGSGEPGGSGLCEAVKGYEVSFGGGGGVATADGNGSPESCSAQCRASAACTGFVFGWNSCYFKGGFTLDPAGEEVTVGKHFASNQISSLHATNLSSGVHLQSTSAETG